MEKVCALQMANYMFLLLSDYDSYKLDLQTSKEWLIGSHEMQLKFFQS